jgi:hypothetical protein
LCHPLISRGEYGIITLTIRGYLSGSEAPKCYWVVQIWVVPPKNPECESIQDFYFLPITSSLFTKIAFRIFWEVISKK